MSQHAPGPSRATRSTHTLDKQFLADLNLEQSPLKQARQARTGGWKPRPDLRSGSSTPSDVTPDRALPTVKMVRAERKRPTPPVTVPDDGPPSPEHKRVRHERAIDFNALGRKPFPGAARAVSVPPAEARATTPERFLDLRHVPGSPWRSPERSRSRVASQPPPSPRAPAAEVDGSDDDNDETGDTTIVQPPLFLSMPTPAQERIQSRAATPPTESAPALTPAPEPVAVSTSTSGSSVPTAEPPPTDAEPSSPLSALTDLPTSESAEPTALPAARSSSPIAVPAGAFDFSLARPGVDAASVDRTPNAGPPPKTPRRTPSLSSPAPGSARSPALGTTPTPTARAQSSARASAASVASMFDALLGAPARPLSRPGTPVRRSATPGARKSATPAPSKAAVPAPSKSVTPAPNKAPGGSERKAATPAPSKTPGASEHQAAAGKAPGASEHSAAPPARKTPTPAPRDRKMATPAPSARKAATPGPSAHEVPPAAPPPEPEAPVSMPASPMLISPAEEPHFDMVVPVRDLPEEPMPIVEPELQPTPEPAPVEPTPKPTLAPLVIAKRPAAAAAAGPSKLVQAKLSFRAPPPTLGSRRITRSASSRTVPLTNGTAKAEPVKPAPVLTKPAAVPAKPGNRPPANKGKGKAPAEPAGEDAVRLSADKGKGNAKEVDDVPMEGAAEAGQPKPLEPPHALPPQTPGKLIIPTTQRARVHSGGSRFAQPTASSQAKSRPSSPVRAAAPPRTPGRAADDTSLLRRPRASSITGSGIRGYIPKPPSTSLANLSRALQKLAAPAPERRPNTSLGFSERGGLSTDDDDDDDDSAPAAPERGPTIKRTSSTMSVESSASQPMAKRRQSVSSSTAPAARASGSSNTTSSSAFKTPTASNVSSNGSRAGTSTGAERGMHVAGPIRNPFGPKKPMFGAGPGLGGTKLMGARNGMKASKAPTLAMVEASPMKGAGDDADAAQGLEPPQPEDKLSAPAFGDEPMDEVAAATPERTPGESDTETPGLAPKRKWTGRVSLASQALTQTLAELPLTPPAPEPAAPTHSRHTRSRTAMGPPAAPGAQDTSPAGSAAGKHVSRRAGPAQAGEARLGVLKSCTVFVDVRTDEGDDAGGLFAEMIQGMGARLVGRVGPSCTHIVFKNGLMSTITKWRLLNEPRAEVVGIAWVVECVEQRIRVDEARFRVDLENMNMAGTNKRRRSMVPKSFVDFGDGMTTPGDTSDVSMDGDTPSAGTSTATEHGGLTPLERARLRKAAR